jgi:hypothetical protein
VTVDEGEIGCDCALRGSEVVVAVAAVVVVVGVGIQDGDIGSDSGGDVAVDMDVGGGEGTTKMDWLAGVGVTGDEVLVSPESSLSSFSFSSLISSSTPFMVAVVVAVAVAATVLAPPATETSALLPLFPFCGGGFTANSCAPGMGGGMNDEDGDGKGEELGGVSISRERRGCGWGGCKVALVEVPAERKGG